MKEAISKALSNLISDFDVQREFAREQAGQGLKWKEASVLVLLKPRKADAQNLEDYDFVLNKRSNLVAQPGDLCWPGGHPNSRLDGFAARFLLPRVFGFHSQPGFRDMMESRRHATCRVIRFFLACALREAWEEMRIFPASVEFLGALPCYRMISRRMILYPMVGMVGHDARFRINYEIEKNIFLPAPALLNENNYGTYRLVITGRFKELYGTDHADFPCFVVDHPDGTREVLWGATYNILMGLLFHALGWVPPANPPRRAQNLLYPERA